MMRRRLVCAMSVLSLTSATYSASAAAGGPGNPPRRGRPAPLPPGYVLMGNQYGVPPMVLYGVALQESAKLFGADSLPWPWTLNVERVPRRYGSYVEAVAGLRSVLASGIRNVDTGLMQVNWHYHHDKLVTASAAIDPYPNLAVGARILRGHFESANNWVEAIGRYHSPKNKERAADYAARVLRRIEQVPQTQAGGRNA